MGITTGEAAIMTGKGGLEGIVAATSALTYIDGEEGYLSYRGIDIFELAEHGTFEEVAFLMLRGHLPTQEELAAFNGQLVAARPLPELTVQTLRLLSGNAEPMEALRTAVSTLSSDDPERDETTHESNQQKAIRLTARIATIIGTWAALEAGQEPRDSDPELSHAGNLLWLITGEKPSALQTRVLDQALILHMDHEMPASTFAARVTAATLSDMYSAVTSAVGALKGPLHGGANQRVMEMLEHIGEPAKAAEWVRDALARKERIMGFGHRVYKTYDPRARILKKMADELARETGDRNWLDMSEIVEETVLAEKGLYPNVDFYAASVYRMLGIPTNMFTTIFAASRVVGWAAHVVEQHDDNRLIRPTSDYTGPTSAPWIPMGQRQATPVA